MFGNYTTVLSEHDQATLAMAEIIEAPEKDAAGASEAHGGELSEPPFDPNTMRKSRPGLKRFFITLSYLVSFILCLPFLYKSVEIYRSPLPFRDIDYLSSRLESQPLTFPFKFRASFVGFDSYPGPLHHSISEEIDKLTRRRPHCGSMNYTLSVTVDSSSDRFAAVDFDRAEGDDVDELLRPALEGNGEYTVVVVRGKKEKAVVGKYRHAWMVIGEVETAAERIAEVLVNVFVNGGREDASVRSEFMPVGADGRVVFSFSLLNADPLDWVYDWDFEMIDQILLAPVVDALGAVANISVESQVLYHTPKASLSYWDQKLESYVFHPKDLSFFVNSNEWHLDTSIAAGGRSKILHFVVYVPSAKECPLLLQLSDGEISKTNGFISPMWGGIVVWNPQSCLDEKKDKYKSRHTIPFQNLQNIFEVFMGQLRQLLGLNSIDQFVGKSGIWNLLVSERGFADWELDVLARQHTCFNLHSCATTLGSLSRLVQSLPRMIIMDEIGKQVRFSLEAAKVAQNNASDGAYDASAASSRQARSLAEDAFFHPSIMSVSYYSFEHCFAVYSPFFLPVSMHVVLSALREIRRYKREKAKYLAWMTKLKKSS